MKNTEMRYFAASNSENGFYGLFGKIFDPEKFGRIYIIKGGPGTGKSTLMRKIGKEAENRGYEAEYVLCASDPDSLDGVIIPSLSAAILDGTFPHVIEPKYPGAVETAVDLYHALGKEKLRENRDKIIALALRGERETATAFRYLRAQGEIAREALETAKECYDSEKAGAAADRIVRRLFGGGGMERRFIGAIYSGGYKRLETYYLRAANTYAVTDKCGLGYEFLTRMLASARKNGLSVTACPSPLMPDFAEALYFEKCGAYFAVCENDDDAEKYDKKINIMRFISKTGLAESRSKLRFAARCRDALADGAAKCFTKARESHAELEKIYGEAMDYSEADRAFENICGEIF